MKDFKLLHVAVVDLQSYAYIGRAFFGNPATGQLTWDCDCRPSDACWLALQVRCCRCATLCVRCNLRTGPVRSAPCFARRVPTMHLGRPEALV